MTAAIRIPAIFPIALLFSACTIDPGDTKIIAHAGTGDGLDHPKNSREALLSALEIGADGIELDVQLTRDSVLVIYHDQDLNSLTACNGIINSMSWIELQECPPQIDGRTFRIERVDSLLLTAAKLHPDAIFMLDCKLFAHAEWWPYLEAFTDALVQLDRHRSLKGRLMIECMVDDFLLLLQRKNDQIALFIYGKDPEHLMHRAITSRYTGITIHDREIDAGEVRKAKGLGLQVALLGVGNSFDHWWALRKRPDLLQTDSPEDLVKDH